jgi:hypothetical protein
MQEFKALTAKERRHLKTVALCNTLEQFKRTAAEQARMRRKPGAIEPCWDCKFIARKLGLKV